MNFYLEKMIELGADGVDFHAFAIKPPDCYISQSNTKEDFMNGDILTPRSGYTFWKIENGEKKYLYEKNESKSTVEILGSSELNKAFYDLGIVAKYSYYGESCCIWELSKTDFDKICNIPDKEWKDDWGWWRYAESSVIRHYPTSIFTVNNSSMIGYFDEERLNDYVELCLEDYDMTEDEVKKEYFSRKYDGLRSYLCNVIGASTESNVCAVAKDIAKLNNLTLGELFLKYSDK